jgi:hypothetical protein
MRRLLFVAMAAVVAGCAAPYMWTHPEHNDKAKFDRDRAQCIYEAKSATASYSQGATARSYSGAISQGLSEGLEMGSRQGELGVLCMEARGYARKPIDSTAR